MAVMTTEKTPRRRLCRRRRRQHHLPAAIGVNFRQQHLQRAMNTLRRMKVTVAAMMLKTKSQKKSLRKAKVDLIELEAKHKQLIAETRYALEESAWTQACSDAMEALLFAP